MGVQVTFNLAAWRLAFPEFSTIADAQILGYEGMAEILHRNDGGGPVSTANSQTQLLNLVVAHIAYLFGGVNGQPAPEVVGRINSASEGSVSVGLDMGPVTNSQAWWITSRYGALYWTMTTVYRRMRYLPSGGSYAGVPLGGAVPGIGMGWPYG